MNDRKIKKSFAYADKQHIKYVIVVGNDELDKGMYTLKDMQTGNQEMLSLEDIISKINK